MMGVNDRNLESLYHAINSRECTGTFAPAVYVVELTRECNLSCIICPHHRIPAIDRQPMTVDSFIRIAEKIAPYAELVMLYFMGEPTLHPEFSFILEVARKILKGKIVVSTNGYQVSTDSLEAMIKFCDIIICPIDRWRIKEYETIRRGSNFSDVVKNIEKLIQIRDKQPDNSTPEIIVKMLGMQLPHTEQDGGLLNEVQEFTNYWEERGAKVLFGWLSTWAGQIPNLSRLSTTQVTGPHDFEPCADLWFKMVVDCKGNVPLCCYDFRSSVVVGNLCSQDLFEVWQGDDAVNNRRAFCEDDVPVPDMCLRCSESSNIQELHDYIELSDDGYFRVF